MGRRLPRGNRAGYDQRASRLLAQRRPEPRRGGQDDSRAPGVERGVRGMGSSNRPARGARSGRSAGHYQYVAAAKQNRLRGDVAKPYWAYRITERAPAPGDLVCKARPVRGACGDISFDNVDNRTARPAHCDIVTARRGEEISVVGGNLGDSAKSYTIRTPGGFLPATDRDGCRSLCGHRAGWRRRGGGEAAAGACGRA